MHMAFWKLILLSSSGKSQSPVPQPYTHLTYHLQYQQQTKKKESQYMERKPQNK
jgi:hypothetical protein